MKAANLGYTDVCYIIINWLYAIERNTIMDLILNRICSIENHPVSKLDIKFRIKYVRGLGACLYVLSSNSHITKMLYWAWANSIIRDTSNLYDYWTNDLSAAKSAISLQRKRFSFFSMRYSFFYDVFYLLEHSFLSGNINSNIYNFLKENLCGFFTKKTLENVYKHFSSEGVTCKNIDESLIEHRRKNNTILSQKEKKILVVANVSAGKSTLINALVGHRINRTKTTACTNRLVAHHNKIINDGYTLKENDNSYRYCCNISEVNNDNIVETAFPFNSSLSNERICFIDTPGFNNAKELKHRKITKDAILKGDYDAVIYVSNSMYFGTNDEHNLLELLKVKVKKPILFVLNQLDNFVPEEDSIAKMLNDYKSDLIKFGFKKPIIVPVSAYASFLFRTETSLLSKIEMRKLEMLNEVFECDYYDLPMYINEQSSKDKLSMTGIISLENKLITI